MQTTEIERISFNINCYFKKKKKKIFINQEEDLNILDLELAK